MKQTHLDTLLRGHLPLVHLVRLVPYQDLLDLVGSVLRVVRHANTEENKASFTDKEEE